MNVIQRAVVQQLLGQRCAIDRINRLPVFNIALQQFSSIAPNTRWPQRAPPTIQCRTLATDKTLVTNPNAAGAPVVNGTVPKSVDRPSLLYRVRSFFGLIPLERHVSLNRKLGARTYKLYHSLVKRIKYRQFFDTFGLPNTFNSFFVVTELHVWMVSVRAMGEGAGAEENGRFIRNALMQTMWKDIDVRLKTMSNDVTSSTIRQQTTELCDQFKYTLLLYDEALLSDDTVLANALWQRVFNADCNDWQRIELLVRYVRNTIYNLDQSDSEAFMDAARLPWLMPLGELDKRDE